MTPATGTPTVADLTLPSGDELVWADGLFASGVTVAAEAVTAPAGRSRAPGAPSASTSMAVA